MRTPARTTRHMTVDSPEWPEDLQLAARILREGGLVALPTETVYGLGADALSAVAVSGIYAAKGRPSDNPLIVHIADVETLEGIAVEISAKARTLMAAFWPGPLTLVLRRGTRVPDAVTAGLDTVAVRMPSHPVALALIRAAGTPIAAPSANRSGKPSPTTATDVAEDLDGRIDAIVDGGSCTVGLESTVLDVTVEPPMILRPGGVTREMLERIVGPVAVDPALAHAGQNDEAPLADDAGVSGVNASGDRPAAGRNPRGKPVAEKPAEGTTAARHSAGRGTATGNPADGTTAAGHPAEGGTAAGHPADGGAAGASRVPRSPGMKYRHYAPEAQVTVFAGARESVVAAILEAVATAKRSGGRVGVLCSDESREAYEKGVADAGNDAGADAWTNTGTDAGTAVGRILPDLVVAAGSLERPETYAAGIFRALRDFDRAAADGCDVDVVFAEGMSDEGIGHAVMNRLGKAAGGRIIRV